MQSTKQARALFDSLEWIDVRFPSAPGGERMRAYVRTLLVEVSDTRQEGPRRWQWVIGGPAFDMGYARTKEDAREALFEALPDRLLTDQIVGYDHNGFPIWYDGRGRYAVRHRYSFHYETGKDLADLWIMCGWVERQIDPNTRRKSYTILPIRTCALQA